MADDFLADAVSNVVRGPRAIASQNALGDPDQAAENFNLSKATGVPVSAIEADPDGFKAQIKQRTAGDIVQNNPHLRQFISSDPNAAKVSSDDLGQLDTISKSLGPITQPSLMTKVSNVAHEAIGGFEEGFDRDSFNQGLKDLYNYSDSPIWKSMAYPFVGLAAVGLEGMSRLFTGTLDAGEGALRQGAIEMGADPTQAASFARDMNTMIQSALMVAGGTAEHVPPELNDMARAAQKAAPYVEAKRPIPVGVDPFIDEIKKEESSEALESLKSGFKESLDSEMRKRSPDIYRDFLAQRAGEDTVGVSADTAAALYGNKTPEEGDGILGFVKDIGDQYTQAMVTGSDIQVPIADMMTYMDPEVFKAIEPGIRPRDDGFTANEDPAWFHGTHEKFNQFQNEFMGQSTSGEDAWLGFHFASSADYAKGYAEGTIGGRVISAHLDYSNPKEVNLGQFSEKELVDNQEIIADEIRKAWAEGHDAIIMRNATAKGHKFDHVVVRDASQIKQIDPNHITIPEGGAVLTSRGVANEAKGEGVNDPGKSPFTGQGLLQTPAAIDMSKVQGVQYAKAIADQQKVEYETALRKAEAEEAKRLSPEWRANTKDMRDAVISDVADTPKFIADMGIRRGEIPKIDGNALTDEQKAGLPRMYWSAKDGRLPDIIANFTGHATGDDLVSDLSALHANRAGVAPEKYLTDLVNRETNYRMEAKYGKLGENVLESARELTLSQTNLDLMHAELEYLAAEHGLQMPYTKEGLKDQARSHIGDTPLKSISSDRFLAAAARASNRTEAALLSEDPVTAFKARQEKWASMVYAKEAARIEGIKEKFDKIVGRYSKMTADSIPATYAKDWVNQIHQLMLDFEMGKKARRSVQNVAESIRMDGLGQLDQFAAAKSWAPEGFALRDVPVPDGLTGFPKVVDKMTVDQFQEFHNLMAAMDKGAREDGKVEFKGAKVEYEAHRNHLIQQMADRYGDKKLPPTKGGVSDLARRLKASSTPLEAILNHIDHWVPGDFFDTFVRPYADASAYEDVMLKETNAKMVKANEGYDMRAGKKAKNDFWMDPRTNQPVANWRRRNTLGVLANVGNEGNLRVLAEGWGKTPEEVMQWVFANTTPEDWKYMERVGKIQNDIFEKANKMGHDVSGVATDRVPLGQIVTPHGVYDGWYHQLIPDIDLKGYAKSPSTKIGSWGENLDSGYFRATTNQGWSRTRTGAVYHVLLDVDGLPLRMKQMIHDIAVRPTLIQLNKFFTDKKFTQAVSDYIGRAQADELTPFLRDFAGSVNFQSRTQVTWGRFFGQMTEGAVSGMVNFNPGTIAKHNLSALAGSLVQVGPKDFAREMFSLTRQGDLAADSNWKTAHEKFVEVQRRMKTFHEMLGEVKSDMTLDGLQTMSSSFRTAATWSGHFPIAWLDLQSTVPTALAAYRNAIADGADEGEARALANRAVRATHGSSTITNKPQIARVRNPWLKPFVPFYAFFNHILAKQFELASNINEAAGLAYGREFSSAAAMVPRITGLFMAYVIVPTVVEQMISPYTNSKHEAWGTTAAKMFTNTAGSSFIGVRDLTHALVNGTEAGVGIYGEMGNALINPIRDVFRPDRGSPQWRGRFLKDMLMLSAMTHGLGGSTPGNTAKYMSDYFSGQAHPRGPMDWITGLRYGTNKGHSRSGEEWLRKELGQ